ncbi:hypothetical protein [Duganella sp. LjRoot269]|jgi:hypothetical protein|uniref:hypothetical protein n=1 Tax=Duganella sp. LjRoot269 TaxID=3342305 RepID=UPI003ECC1B39
MRLLEEFLVNVRQNEIGILSRDIATIKTILYTDGFNPCIAVVLWNKKWVVLHHLHDSRDGSFQLAYEAVIDKMRKSVKNREAIIYGVIAYAETYDDSQIDNRTTVKDWLEARSVVLRDDLICTDESGRNSIAVSRDGDGADPEIKVSVRIMRQGACFITNAIRLPFHKSQPTFTIVDGINSIRNCELEEFKKLGFSYGAS